MLTKQRHQEQGFPTTMEVVALVLQRKPSQREGLPVGVQVTIAFQDIHYGYSRKLKDLSI